MTNLTDLTTDQLHRILVIKEQIEKLEGEIKSIAGGDGEVPNPSAVGAPQKRRRRMSAAARVRIAAGNQGALGQSQRDRRNGCQSCQERQKAIKRSWQGGHYRSNEGQVVESKARQPPRKPSKRKIDAAVRRSGPSLRRLPGEMGEGEGGGEKDTVRVRNPMVIDKARIDAEIARLSRFHCEHQETMFKLRSRVRHLTDDLPRLEQRLEGVRQDIAIRQDTSGDKFLMVLEGQEIRDAQSILTASRL